MSHGPPLVYKQEDKAAGSAPRGVYFPGYMSTARDENAVSLVYKPMAGARSGVGVGVFRLPERTPTPGVVLGCMDMHLSECRKLEAMVTQSTSTHTLDVTKTLRKGISRVFRGVSF